MSPEERTQRIVNEVQASTINNLIDSLAKVLEEKEALQKRLDDLEKAKSP